MMKGSSAVLFAAMVAAYLAGCGCSRSPAAPGTSGGGMKGSSQQTASAAAGGVDTLRLRGGWARGKTKHTSRRLVFGKRAPKPQRSGTESIVPGSGDRRKSQIERFHGSAVVAAVLRAASPRSIMFDPRTAMLRHGMRLDRHDVPTDAYFSHIQKGDVNGTLLKVAHRGLAHLVEDLVAAGADINHVGKKGSSCPGHLIGYSPLSAAAHSGRVETVAKLIKLGCDIRGGEEIPPYFGWDFWMELTNGVARKRQLMEKAERTKSGPWRGNGRRDPGVRKTRHARGARGGNR